MEPGADAAEFAAHNILGPMDDDLAPALQEKVGCRSSPTGRPIRARC